MVNFTACRAAFVDNQTNLELYSYHGRTRDIKDGDHHYITTQGCKDLCGTGSDFYPWSVIADTMITWILPMLVMFLLAPFEPNQRRNTIFSSIRWIGSPFVSMWYVLCNIKMTARVAELVDMAVPYRVAPDEDSDFSDFRDGMTILVCMNQYLLNIHLMERELGHCAEQVLRIALFGDMDLIQRGGSLRQRRRKIAMSIRTKRRRGVVQILLGLIWFLFVLGLSISFTFNEAGENAASHNLAMGLAVSWITPLVMGAVVDRNPTATKDLGSKFNCFLQEVRDAIRSNLQERKSARDKFDLFDEEHSASSINDALMNNLPTEMFIEFAGQGRLRWHKGIAHPILAGIEKSFAARHGRGWLEEPRLARRALLIPFGPEGFAVADRRLFIQAVAAFLIIYGNLGAGFLISYYTPTIGMGCRAMGYMIFGVLTMAAALGELCMEFITAPTSSIRRLGFWTLTILEFINVCWLVAIAILQTSGAYQTCYCLGSMSDPRGGYIEFDDIGNARSPAVLWVWSIGIFVAGMILLLSLVYIVSQWMEQSHLMTSEYGDARQGLMWTRRWKRVRSWFLWLPCWLLRAPCVLLSFLTGWKAEPKRLTWST